MENALVVLIIVLVVIIAVLLSGGESLLANIRGGAGARHGSTYLRVKTAFLQHCDPSQRVNAPEFAGNVNLVMLGLKRSFRWMEHRGQASPELAEAVGEACGKRATIMVLDGDILCAKKQDMGALQAFMRETRVVGRALRQAGLAGWFGYMDADALRDAPSGSAVEVLWLIHDGPPRLLFNERVSSRAKFAEKIEARLAAFARALSPIVITVECVPPSAIRSAFAKYAAR